MRITATRLSMLAFAACVNVVVGAANAQSSSLYVEADSTSILNRSNLENRLSPEIARVSLVAAALPEPREFSVHDLITIIVRESIEADASSSISTEKETTISGQLTQFPDLRPEKLLQLKLDRGDLAGNEPAVDVTYTGEFEGDGDYQRSDSFTTRMTARIVDIKPNGTLVLEARKRIQSDEESVTILLTGTCRKDDISASNTVLSTQIYDLQLVKEHKGELRRATKKGLLTKVFETIFNF